MDYKEVVKERRSIYGIGKDINISEDQLKKLVEEAVLYTPSAFNSQGSRAVLLLGKHHLRLWEIVKESLQSIIDPDKFGPTEQKIKSFSSGHGTILFYEDNNIVKELQNKFQLYKDNFPVWASHTNGMLQYIMWTSLESVGLGASLQHYNPLIDEKVKKEFNIPESWDLIGQMPFGSKLLPPQEKENIPVEERVKIFID